MAEHWRAKAETQASKVVHALQEQGEIKSVGTFRNYEQALTQVAQALKDANMPSLNNLTPQIANDYLASRALEVKQSQLNMERQAMQKVMQHFNHNLSPKETLPVVKSELKEVLQSRAYTPEQIREIATHQTPHNAISTEIAHAAGLRAHELFTIRPISERDADARPSHEAKFEQREGVSYTVTGKGGLTREIQLPRELSDRLEGYRLPEPEKVTDRGVHYEREYAIGGGNSWSSSFSRVSKNNLGWSRGAHGLRHTYAQERMHELQSSGYEYREALTVTSQEMGHFRPEITEVYLR